jgi:hypothetical protein
MIFEKKQEKGNLKDGWEIIGTYGISHVPLLIFPPLMFTIHHLKLY